MITGRTLFGSLLTVCLSLLAVTIGALSASGLDNPAAASTTIAASTDAAASTAAATAAATATTGQGSPATDADPPPYKPKSKAELRRSLSSMQYRVTQEAETEPAFSNRYWNNKRPGIYKCIVCDQPLFSSLTKFKSGTGWPSFYAPLSPVSIGAKRDWKMRFPRIEVHCNRCGAHLGHVFNDGPPPTGKRFCLNSAALNFVEAGNEPPTESSAPLPASQAVQGQ